MHSNIKQAKGNWLIKLHKMFEYNCAFYFKNKTGHGTCTTVVVVVGEVVVLVEGLGVDAVGIGRSEMQVKIWQLIFAFNFGGPQNLLSQG